MSKGPWPVGGCGRPLGQDLGGPVKEPTARGQADDGHAQTACEGGRRCWEVDVSISSSGQPALLYGAPTVCQAVLGSGEMAGKQAGSTHHPHGAYPGVGTPARLNRGSPALPGRWGARQHSQPALGQGGPREQPPRPGWGPRKGRRVKDRSAGLRGCELSLAGGSWGGTTGQDLYSQALPTRRPHRKPVNQMWPPEPALRSVLVGLVVIGSSPRPLDKCTSVP